MLEKVSIQNFRNLKDLNLVINPSINLIVASNGSGKTNFLESIYYSVFGDSFRPVLNNYELFYNKSLPLKISLEINQDKLNLILNETQRKFVLNNKKIFLSKIANRFPIILFAPQSVDLVAREPGIRRQDLDHFLGIIDPKYKEIISRYKTVLKNRNSMIKMIRDKKAKDDNLDFWTEKLVETGFQIFKTRSQFFKEIKIEMKNTLEILEQYIEDDSFKTLDVNYLSFIPDLNEDNFIETMHQKYIDNFQKEIIVGKTLYGVHKDDFQITLRNMNLRFLGSRGQQRIGILLFKLAEAFYIKKIYNQMPLILLDDLMSELDNQNREKISTILLKIDAQIIVTTADINEIPLLLREVSNTLLIF